MFIKNIKTGVTQECSNQDVIKVCRKHPDEYQIAEKREELVNNDTGGEGAPEGEDNEKDILKMKVSELKALAKEHGIEGADSLNKEELIKVLKDVISNE